MDHRWAPFWIDRLQQSLYFQLLIYPIRPNSLQETSTKYVISYMGHSPQLPPIFKHLC